MCTWSAHLQGNVDTNCRRDTSCTSRAKQPRALSQQFGPGNRNHQGYQSVPRYLIWEADHASTLEIVFPVH